MLKRIAILSYDLNCIIVISSITKSLKEPNLVERSIVLELERIDAKKRKSESEIWKRFDKDIPKILGSIFNIIAQVLQDDEPIEKANIHEKIAEQKTKEVKKQME